MAIHPKDRELVAVLTAILHAPRLYAHEQARLKLLFTQTGKLPAFMPDIKESAGAATVIINMVDRHIAPSARAGRRR